MADMNTSFMDLMPSMVIMREIYKGEPQRYVFLATLPRKDKKYILCNDEATYISHVRKFFEENLQNPTDCELYNDIEGLVKNRYSLVCGINEDALISAYDFNEHQMEMLWTIVDYVVHDLEET